MLLAIPVSKLLSSQLDIGIDPSSGNLTYNIKDGPSPLQYVYGAGNLVLMLQSSSGDGTSSMCLRVCTNDAAHSAPQSVDVCQALEFAPALFGLEGGPDRHYARPTAKSSSASFPDIHSSCQGFFTTPSGYGNQDRISSPYDPQPDNQEPVPEQLLSQASLWEVPRDKSSQSPQEPSLMSPISKTLSLITSGSIFEGKTEADSLPRVVNGFQHNADHLHADPERHQGIDITQCYPSESTSKMIDGQAFEESIDASVSSASPPTTVMFSGSGASAQNPPLSQHSVLSMASQWTTDSISIEGDQSVIPPALSSDINQESSLYDAFRTASPSISDSSAPDSRPASRESNKREGYPCPHATCHRILKSLYTQQLHMKTHVAKPRKNFSCTMGCSESFTRHHDRLRHEVSQHGKQCEFSCKRCDRFFSSQRMLDRHTCWSSRVGLLRWQLKDCNDSHPKT